MNSKIKLFLPHIVALFVFLGLNVVYFSPQFQGKVMEQGDLVQFQAMAKEAMDYNNTHDKQTLWTGSMFSGMPTYQMTAGPRTNYTGYAFKVLSLGFDRPVGYFLTGMICFYIMALCIGINPWLGIVGSIIFGFATNNFILFEAGHATKVNTLFTLPLLVAGVYKILKKNYLFGTTLLALGAALNLLANHPQMSYYFVLGACFVFGYEFIKLLINKEFKHVAISAVCVALAAALAVGSSWSRISSTLDYSKDTMRGAPILKSDATQTVKSVDGLEYDYATQWSNNSIDLLASFIPKAAGGGSGEWVDRGTDLAKALGQTKAFQAPTYWGGLPFTSGPIYLGIVALFLCVISLAVHESKVKYGLLAAILLTLGISLGHNFNILNEFLFYNMPGFNKFRTPNSVLTVTIVFVAWLALLGINTMLNTTAEKRAAFIKPVVRSAIGVGGFCILMAIMGGMFFSFSNEASDQQYANILEPLTAHRQSMLSSSAWTCAFLVGMAFTLIYFFLKGKISSAFFALGLGLVVLFDFFPIAKNYLSNKDFVSQNRYSQNFEPRPVDAQILKDQDIHYRVYDASVNTFNSASTSYYHKTIGGYSPVKLQRYQDLIDRHIAKGNQSVLNMLNTKYFIMPNEQAGPQAQLNPGAYGNAWFVDSIKMVENPNAEIDALSNISKNVAIVHKEFATYVQGFNPVVAGEIKLTKYEANKVAYTSESTSDQLAVFSEIWYGPNKGWKVTIDGKEVEHIRVNYLLRGLKVPAGKHEIKFEFYPEKFFQGETISGYSSMAILLAFIGALLFQLFKWYKSEKILA
jgi:hypothetical protein